VCDRAPLGFVLSGHGLLFLLLFLFLRLLLLKLGLPLFDLLLFFLLLVSLCFFDKLLCVIGFSLSHFLLLIVVKDEFLTDKSSLCDLLL